MLATMNINYVGVLLAAIASMIVGWIWFGPLFGKSWKQLSGSSGRQADKMKKGEGKGMAIEFVLSLLMGYVLAYIVKASMAANAFEGLQVGAWIWLGFLLPLTVGGALWESKPVKLVMIKAGFRLVQAMAMGAVIGWWG